MLKEIQCNGFRSNGIARDSIRFHMGLNTILGGYSADNSIGKSTMLSIIDFCFGGDTFPGEKISDHFHEVFPINFTFEFDGKEYRFSKQEDQPQKVWECDEGYIRKKEISNKDLTDFLKKKYHLENYKLSFREFVGVCSRFHGRYNVVPEKPLTTYRQQKDRKAIDNFEKMSSSYNKLSTLKAECKNIDDKTKAFNSARKYEFLPSQIGKRQYAKNQQQIKDLESKLNSIADHFDKTTTEEDYSNAVAAEELKSRIRILKRNQADYLSSRNTIMNNLKEGRLPDSEDIRKLKRFFPGVELKDLSAVISFHKKIDAIMKNEMEEEIKNLDSMLIAVGDEISKNEEALKKLFTPKNVDIHAFEEYSEVKRLITLLSAQNKSFEEALQLREQAKQAKENLEKEEAVILKTMEQKMNSKLILLNKKVYGDGRATHELLFSPTGASYSFENPFDKGTGTSYKSLILFDLALLSLSKMPFVIHDSMLFKNIGDQPVEQIMNLYGDYKDRQIFISFDKIDSYSGSTPQILLDSKVLYISEGGNELYGESWAKKEKQDNKNDNGS